MPTRTELAAAAGRIVDRIAAHPPHTGYTRDLAHEAVLHLSVALQRPSWLELVAAGLAGRTWPPDWRMEPFCSLSWAWLRHGRGDAAAFVAGARAMRAELPRTADGLVTHPRGASRGGGDAVLLDSFQAYASRLARAGAIAGDPDLIADAGEQVQRHRDLLRLPGCGLWRQGRGWFGGDPERLSPGAWSRGQGWLLKGLSEAAQAAPDEPRLRAVLAEAAADILGAQQPSGMWHAMPHLPPGRSRPEASGTGLIAAAFCRCVASGLLPAQPYAEAARRALDALLPRIAADGVVHDACPGPGPLVDEAPWTDTDFRPGDPHGPGCVLEALAEAIASG